MFICRTGSVFHNILLLHESFLVVSSQHSRDRLLDPEIDRVDLNDRSTGNSVGLDRPTRLWGILSTHLDSGQR